MKRYSEATAQLEEVLTTGRRSARTACPCAHDLNLGMVYTTVGNLKADRCCRTASGGLAVRSGPNTRSRRGVSRAVRAAAGARAAAWRQRPRRESLKLALKTMGPPRPRRLRTNAWPNAPGREEIRPGRARAAEGPCHSREIVGTAADRGRGGRSVKLYWRGAARESERSASPKRGISATLRLLSWSRCPT